MREVKYRAWDKEDKVMRLVQSINYASDGFAGTVRVELVGKPHSCVHGESCILLQYTGNKDDNDVEICEGDIVEFEFYDGKEIYFVIYDESGFRYSFVDLERHEYSYKRSQREKLRVIGNIYNDQKLMNK